MRERLAVALEAKLESQTDLMTMRKDDSNITEFIDLDKVNDLATRVTHDARRADYCETAFSEIAENVLTDFDADLIFHPETISAFISSTPVAQKSFLAFSDLPITLFSNKDFYIEALFWFSASTEIHSHGFSGAFRVMQGSSLHNCYTFSKTEHCSDKALLGDLTCTSSEYLRAGSVRRIGGGRSGLIHSLFHLDQPSISLVIRTHSSSIFQPQYAFYRPGIGLDTFNLSKDAEVRLHSRLISVCAGHERRHLEDLIKTLASTQDFPRLAFIMITNAPLLQSSVNLEEFWPHAAYRHGDKTRYLRTAFDVQIAKERLMNLRGITEDPKLRYFIACLLVSTSRDILDDLLSYRDSQTPRVQILADSLVELARLSPSPRRLLDDMSRWQEQARYALPSLLTAIIQQAEKSGDRPESWLRKILECQSNADTDARLTPAELASYKKLQEIPELSPLWLG